MGEEPKPHNLLVFGLQRVVMLLGANRTGCRAGWGGVGMRIGRAAGGSGGESEREKSGGLEASSLSFAHRR